MLFIDCQESWVFMSYLEVVNRAAEPPNQRSNVLPAQPNTLFGLVEHNISLNIWVTSIASRDLSHWRAANRVPDSVWASTPQRSLWQREPEPWDAQFRRHGLMKIGSGLLEIRRFDVCENKFGPGTKCIGLRSSAETPTWPWRSTMMYYGYFPARRCGMNHVVTPPIWKWIW